MASEDGLGRPALGCRHRLVQSAPVQDDGGAKECSTTEWTRRCESAVLPGMTGARLTNTGKGFNVLPSPPPSWPAYLPLKDPVWLLYPCASHRHESWASGSRSPPSRGQKALQTMGPLDCWVSFWGIAEASTVSLCSCSMDHHTHTNILSL